MEALYEMFEAWPLDLCSLQGLLILVFIVGMVLFRIKFFDKPEKK